MTAEDERYRLLAESIPSITWTADSQGEITYLNDRWFRYTGMPPDGMATHWSNTYLHKDDVARVSDAWRKSLANGTEHRVECRVRRSDGMYRWFEAHAMPVRDDSGQVTQWYGTTTDIDDRKRAEEIAAFMSRASAELAQISDYRETLRRIAGFAIPAFADWCGIFLMGEDGSAERLGLFNEDMERVRLLHLMRDRYPYRPTDKIGPGKVLRTGLSCWSQEMTEEMLRDFSHNEEHLEMLRHLNFRSWVCVPIRLKQRIGGAISFVMTDSGRVYSEAHLRVAEDLAHRVTIAIENYELVAQLREEDRRKDEFLAMLAHELRNPLAPIRNSVQILRMKAPDLPELRWAGDVIDRQVQHMSRLVDDLLDVSRVGTGKIELRRDRVALSAAVNSAIEACRPLVEELQHQLSVSMPMEPLHVDADLTRLSQVIANLVNNAVKYTEPKGRIWVSVEREGEVALIRVRDTGIGIAPEMRERIFELFTQIDASFDRSKGGLGIGLTLARRLVEMHGGTIEARSAGLGHGSEFIVRLPVLPDPRSQSQPSPAASRDEVAAGIARVLIVDDNRDAADSMAMVLRARGHEVVVAYDGSAGTSTAMAFQPDVALLDIGLPKVDGHDMARAIRERFGDSVLLVAITGLGQDEDRRRSSQAGFDHHFTKPVDLETLERLVAGIARQ